jgi:hypothetical protein
MSKSNKDLRQELLHARTKLLRQIDILQAMPQSDIFRTEEVEAAPLRRCLTSGQSLRRLKTRWLV